MNQEAKLKNSQIGNKIKELLKKLSFIFDDFLIGFPF